MTARVSRLIRLSLVLAFAPLLALPETACSRVTLISSYDEQMDQSATELQKRMDSFLTMLEEKAGTPEATYEQNKDFYTEYAVDLRAVLIRAQSWPKNTLTEKQIELMSASLGELRNAHESAPIQAAAIPTFRDLFNQSWRAILVLEHAKKRGQQPAEE